MWRMRFADLAERWQAWNADQRAREREVHDESRHLRFRETGQRSYHPPTCGGCHGAGCPVVELVDEPEAWY